MSETRHRILLVEDSADDQLLVRRALAPEGTFELEVAESLDESLERLEGEGFDAIILDLTLPDSDAKDTFGHVHQRAPEVPVIVLTGYGDVEFGEAAVEAGAKDYLLKGEQPLEGLLGRCLRYALARARGERALEQALSQLLQSQKMEAVGRLAGGVAHDFNNLLTVILSFGTFVLEELGPDHPARADLEEILAAGRRGEELTSQLLAFSRRSAVRPQVIDLNEAVEKSDRMLRRLLGEDIDLQSDLSPELWSIRADPAALEQVLVNLAVNARDAMPRGGKLTIETRNVHFEETHAGSHGPEIPPGDFVLLGVSDDGAGMDAATLERVFEPFFTTKEPGQGTGLGLSTCYGIVKQAGGHMWVYSEPGRGTTFKTYLPRCDDDGQRAQGSLSAPAAGGDETILLAEDDDQVRALSHRTLSQLGYRVLSAASGDEAMAACRDSDRPVDLLVTDVIMPQMSGRQLAAQVASQHPNVRVLFVSGYTASAIERHGVLEPGVALLQKPFTPSRLAARVRQALDGELPA